MGADLSGAGNVGQGTGNANDVCFHLIMDTTLKVNFESNGKVLRMVEEQSFVLLKQLQE